MSVDTGPSLQDIIENPSRGKTIELVLVAHRGDIETLTSELTRLGVGVKREYPTESVLVEIPESRLAEIQTLDGLASMHESDCFQTF